MTIRIDECRTCGTKHKVKFSSVKTVAAAFKKNPHLIMSKSSSNLHGTVWHMDEGLFSGKSYKLDDETMRKEFPRQVWDWENGP